MGIITLEGSRSEHHAARGACACDAGWAAAIVLSTCYAGYNRLTDSRGTSTGRGRRITQALIPESVRRVIRRVRTTGVLQQQQDAAKRPSISQDVKLVNTADAVNSPNCDFVCESIVFLMMMRSRLEACPCSTPDG